MTPDRNPRPVLSVFAVLAAMAMIAFAIAVIAVGLSLVFPGPAVLYALLLILLGYGWALYAYLKYRNGRQDELLELITAAAESNVPLATAVRAYADDRPTGMAREFWEMLVTFVVFPGYYFLWHRRHRFDYRVHQLADLLDEGLPLSEALRTLPAVASREARLAAAVGERTGRLAVCLRGADRERMAAAWIEVVPRLLYPLVVVWFVFGVGTFNMTMIIPRMRKIISEFQDVDGRPLQFPPVTRWLIATGDFIADYAFLVLPLFPAAFVLTAILIANPTARWYLPVIRWAYRSQIQGQILRLLGSQVEVGRPAPDALWMLAGAEEFPPVVRRALRRAANSADAGEPLAAALRGAGLLPKSFLPMIGAAERTNTLAWTLRELGDYLGGRAYRLVRRLSLLLVPVSVLAVGALVAFVALGMFTPLITLMERLAE